MAMNNTSSVWFFLFIFLSLVCQSFPACCLIQWSGWSSCSNPQCGDRGTRIRTGIADWLHSPCYDCYGSRVQTQQCYGNTPVNCKVSSWTPWSPCSAVQCGKSGLQQRSRTVITNPGCGGTACPLNMQETKICYGTKAVNCTYSAWSKWSACPPFQCGDSQTSTRYIITREQCGGIACNVTALWRIRSCKQTFCVNQGTLLNGECSCKPGYYGSCCQHISK